MFLRLRLIWLLASLCLLLTSFTTSVAAQSLSSPLAFIERAHDIYLNIPDGEQDIPLELLLHEAETYRDDNPESSEIWVACAFARVLYAGDRTNPLTAMSLFKTARDEFETAIKLDRSALRGYATAFLGRLYAMLPGWPLSYGSDRKAKKLLMDALSIDANAMANNAYYGDFLIKQGRIQEARRYLQIAVTSSPPSTESPNWRASLLKIIEERLKDIADET